MTPKEILSWSIFAVCGIATCYGVYLLIQTRRKLRQMDAELTQTKATLPREAENLTPPTANGTSDRKHEEPVDPSSTVR